LEDLPVAHIMTTKELSKYLKLHEITIANMPLRGRFPLFGLAVYGDSIRMLLMVGSVPVKTKRRLPEHPKGKAPEKNLRRKSPRNEKNRLIWVVYIASLFKVS